MSERDTLRSFLFERLAIRGELVQLDAVWQEALSRHDYPEPLRRLLGEMMAAAVLLVGTLKFDGMLTLQLKGEGPVTLGVVECDSERKLRGLIRWQGEVDQCQSLGDLLGKGLLAITLEQGRKGERYQGIVELSGDSIAQALEHYLQHSEQLRTRLWLAADADQAAGMLLQRMPDATDMVDEDAWPRVTQLANTISDDELLRLDAEEVVRRLFHEEDVRLFAGKPVQYECSCSRERVRNTLRLLGEAEVRDVLQEQQSVTVNCEFCHQSYRFDAVDIEALFADGFVMDTSSTQH
jgi:molecular chaperone Hsp33